MIAFGRGVAALACVAVLTCAARSLADLSPSERARRAVPVATVGERAITTGELEDRLMAMPAFQRAKFGGEEPVARRGVLERVLVNDALVAEAAREKADDPLLRYLIGRIRTEATLRALRNAAPISKEAIAAHFQAHAAEFQAPERVHLWRILLETKEEAERLLAKLRPTGTPEAWAELCRDLSIDQATKLRRGTLGFVAADGISNEAGVRVDPALFRAAQGVADGALVPTPVAEGEHFAVVWRRGSTAAKAQTLEEATPEIERVLAETAFRQAKDSLLQELRQRHVRDVDTSLLTSFDVDVASGIVKVHDRKPKTL